MAFTQVFPTPFSPDNFGNIKAERTTFTALNSDASGVATVRFLRRIDAVKFTGPALAFVVNNSVQPPTVTITLPGGTASPTQGYLQIEGV